MTRILWQIRRWGVTTAVKAALACGLAFYLGSLMPAPIDDYKYYAALGAFTVVGLVLADSVKESLQVFGAVAVGVAVAVLVQSVSWTNSVTVALTVAIGYLLGVTRLFGVQRTWAPLAGLFVLAAGGPDPEPMALGYLVQLPMGALVGVLVNALLLAPLGEEDLEPASNHALRLLAHQMGNYADLLREQRETTEEAAADGPADPGDRGGGGGEGPREEPREDHRDDVVHANVVQLEDAQARLRAAVARARRAGRGNPRARLHASRQRAMLQRAEAVNRCSATLIATGVVLGQASAPQDARGAALRKLAEDALRHAGEILADPEAAQERPDLLLATEESIDRMLREASAPAASDTLDHVLFGALAVTLQDCVETFARSIADVELPDVTKG